ELAERHEGSVWISARTGENLEELVRTIGDRLRTNDRVVTLALPLDRGDLLAAAHREGDVLDTAVTEDRVVIHVVLDDVGASRFREWRVSA
ncbi:MAG: GTPase HflX, partial [Acidobacteriota bacterium]|nr:GTPase HflX [Acidobacteriota bacterium]